MMIDDGSIFGSVLVDIFACHSIMSIFLAYHSIMNEMFVKRTWGPKYTKRFSTLGCDFIRISKWKNYP